MSWPKISPGWENAYLTDELTTETGFVINKNVKKTEVCTYSGIAIKALPNNEGFQLDWDVIFDGISLVKYHECYIGTPAEGGGTQIRRLITGFSQERMACIPIAKMLPMTAKKMNKNIILFASPDPPSGSGLSPMIPAVVKN